MTRQILAEVSKLINLVEALIPANPNAPANLRLRNRLERSLAKYFKQLALGFPFGKVERIYNRHVEVIESLEAQGIQINEVNIKEALGAETDSVLDPLLATFAEDLAVRLNGHLATAYISGVAEVVSWGKTKAGIPITYEGPPMEKAIAWAEKHVGTLIKSMDEETKRRLGLVVKNGIQNKRGIPGLARDIKKSFSDMSRFRSQLIARTETTFALSQSSLDTMQDMGIDGKEWVTVGDDDVTPDCEANEAEGVIPVNQSFSGGTMAPPQHPSCRCTVAPALIP